MNPLVWLAIAGILLLVFVVVTLGKVKRGRTVPDASKEVPAKRSRVSGGDD